MVSPPHARTSGFSAPGLLHREFFPKEQVEQAFFMKDV
jgi:hypothetical protein